MQFSAFTSILKALIKTSSEGSFKEIHRLLANVLIEYSVIRPSSFSALLSSFGSSDSESQHQLAFFDNCACRVTKKPVHYQDLLESLVQTPKLLSPLVAAVIEQWPFVLKAENDSAKTDVSEFIAKLLRNLHSTGESLEGLKAARNELVNATEDRKLKSRFKKALKGCEEDEKEEQIPDFEPNKQSSSAPIKGWQNIDLEGIFGSLPAEGTTHNELYRWDQKEVAESLEEGRIAELLLCLCSEHGEVRRQALPNISRFMMKLKVISPLPVCLSVIRLINECRNPSMPNGAAPTS
jgi:nucleolar pre-ribosomal-associated protein 1